MIACPCCRHPTLHARGGFEICPVCAWEDEWEGTGPPGFGLDDPSPANHGRTLAQARAMYERSREGPR